MNKLLQGKNAIIYGAGGLIGSGVASTFASEGATVYLVGRTEATLRAVVEQIGSAGGKAQVAALDALDEQAVEEHARSVVDQAGGIDISFNLTTRGDVQGTRLLEMNVEDFLRPTITGLRSNFITARAASRHMVRRGSGVILMLTSGSGPARTPPDVWPMGGTGPADAATESFMRYLASEVGPKGVRVACLWTAGVTLDPEDLAGDPKLQQLEAAKDALVGMSMIRKRPTIREVADTATFLASDRGSGITASIVNVTSGISAL
ncbi:MAG TPA: SDR family oxidoreductase [Chloroflexota bacterium]|nr:SDR family oxidoreductase [Chloroflexota bacterium]